MLDVDQSGQTVLVIPMPSLFYVWHLATHTLTTLTTLSEDVSVSPWVYL